MLWLIIDVLLALGVTIRLTRAVTVEEIGARLLRHPVEDWAGRIPKGRTADLDEPFMRRRWFWADALSCPYCVSTWIAIGAFATMAIAHATDSWFTLLWRIVSAGLTGSYVMAHLMVALGDLNDDGESDEYDEPEVANAMQHPSAQRSSDVT